MNIQLFLFFLAASGTVFSYYITNKSYVNHYNVRNRKLMGSSNAIYTKKGNKYV